jgi:hypothetical protein
MQVKLKLNGKWWMLPTKQEFTKKELAPYLDIPGVGVLQMGESVHFFDMQTKGKVLKVLAVVKEAVQHGVKPTLSKRGNIAFRRVRNSKVGLPT